MAFKFLIALLVFPASLYSGFAIAGATDEFANYPDGILISQRMRDYRVASGCGKYCENYPTGLSQVRLRDWQR